MRLVVWLQDSDGTGLVDERVPQVRRRDGEKQFFLCTQEVFTPMGLPVSFEIDIGPRGQGLTVRSVEIDLLWVFGFNVYMPVRLRLPTDEVIHIELYEK